METKSDVVTITVGDAAPFDVPTEEVYGPDGELNFSPEIADRIREAWHESASAP